MTGKKLAGILFVVAGLIFLVDAGVKKDIFDAAIGVLILAIGCIYLARK